MPKQLWTEKGREGEGQPVYHEAGTELLAHWLAVVNGCQINGLGCLLPPLPYSPLSLSICTLGYDELGKQLLLKKIPKTPFEYAFVATLYKYLE